MPRDDRPPEGKYNLKHCKNYTMENICTVLITLFGDYIEREKKGPMLLHIEGTKTSLKKNNNK